MGLFWQALIYLEGVDVHTCKVSVLQMVSEVQLDPRRLAPDYLAPDD